MSEREDSIDEIANKTSLNGFILIKYHECRKLFNIETWLHAYVNSVYTCDDELNGKNLL